MSNTNTTNTTTTTTTTASASAPAVESESSSTSTTAPVVTRQLLTQSYVEQARHIWPGRGQHVLAQFDDDSVVVYQAYKASIAQAAVALQRFSGIDGFR